jgi:hypothetical protein
MSMSQQQQRQLQQQRQSQHSPQPPIPPAMSPAAAESPQPIVRVMRLYKPVMHMTPPAPQLRMPADVNEEVNKYSETDFALSNFLLLPDSFGDIYLGEKFSAYVSVVNGAAGTTFSPVQLSVKLKTSSSSVDLPDVKPTAGKVSGYASNLKTAEFTDVVVEHVLSTAGTHSLRVMVEYSDPVTNEPRVLVKNYKFNVLNPLLVSSTALDLGNKYVVQSQITNCTRSLIHIEEVSLLSHRDLTVIKAPVDGDVNNASRFDYFPSLGPDEKYAEGFILEKPVGFMSSNLGMIEVKWSTAMGEHGFVRGEELVAPTATPALGATADATSSSRRKSSTSGQPPMVSFHCLSCPNTAISGKEFEIKFRIFNDNYTSPANIDLRCSNPCNSGEGSMGLLIIGKTSWKIGVLPPRDFVDISVHVVAMSSGLHEFGGVYVTDLTALAKEYCSGSAIAKIFVYDEDSPSSCAATGDKTNNC